MGPKRKKMRSAKHEREGKARPAEGSSSGSPVTDEDWQAHRDVLSCNRYMLENRVGCDVTFLVGEDGNAENISAHRYVLSSRSPVFFTMFHGSLPAGQNKVIELPDIYPEAFKEMMKFLYYDEKALNVDEYGVAIIYCAKKYMVPSLVQLCTKLLEESLTDENVCEILKDSYDLDTVPLKEVCMNYICENAVSIFENEYHLPLSYEIWQDIIQMDTLNLPETTVLKECVRWAEAGCIERGNRPTPQNIRKELGDVLYSIRFPLMSLKEFVAGLKECDVLTHPETMEVLEYFTCDEGKEKPNIRFNTKPRVSPWVNYSRFRYTTAGHTQIGPGNWQAIGFRSNRDIEVRGVFVYGTTTKGATNRFIVKVIDGIYQDDPVIGTADVQLISDGTNKQNFLRLKKPTKITSNKNYTIALEITGNENHWFHGFNHLYPGHCNGEIKLTFFSSPLSMNNFTSEIHGQIPGMVLRAI